MPPAALVAPTSDVGHPLRAGLESLAAGLSDRVGQGVELVGGGKVAAVAASAAIVAGGGAATVNELSTGPDPASPRIERQQAKAKSPALPPGLAGGGTAAPGRTRARRRDRRAGRPHRGAGRRQHRYRPRDTRRPRRAPTQPGERVRTGRREPRGGEWRRLGRSAAASSAPAEEAARAAGVRALAVALTAIPPREPTTFVEGGKVKIIHEWRALRDGG